LISKDSHWKKSSEKRALSSSLFSKWWMRKSGLKSKIGKDLVLAGINEDARVK